VTPWRIPLVVTAIAAPIACGFYLGGPGVGVAIGALVGVAIVYLAVRQRPRGAIGARKERDGPRHLLVVLVDVLEQGDALSEVVTIAGDGGAVGEEVKVMVLAPARIGFLDRWASDVEVSRRDAQRRLVISVASLAAAGVAAEARVGDEDVVQAVEDAVGAFPADEVVLVSAAAAADEGITKAAAELRERLRAEFRWIPVSGPAAR
jgi:hypothetical protein